MNYETTLITTTEDEKVVSKIQRICIVSFKNTNGPTRQLNSEDKRIPTLDFRKCIKESPFSRYNAATAPENILPNRTSSTKLGNTHSENNPPGFISDVMTPINFNPHLMGKKSLKNHRTFPKGILKKGTDSRFSKKFEKYILPEAKAKIFNFEEQEIHENEISPNIQINQDKPNFAETNYTCGDDDPKIFRDSGTDSQSNAIRILLKRPLPF